MKKRFAFIAIICCIGLEAYSQWQQKTDWTSFMAKQDMLFDNLTNKWEEGIFLGNGLLGVMIYRENDNALRFDLGRTDVVDHREGINPSLGRCRLPIGRFLMQCNSPIKKIQLRLDLWNAEVKGTIITADGPIQLKGFIPANKDVMIFQTTGNQYFSWKWLPEISKSPFATLRDSSSSYKPNPPATFIEENKVNYHYQPLTVGGSYTTAWKQSDADGTRSLFITIANTWPNNDSKKLAGETLQTITSAAVPALMTAHRSEWRRFYQQSFIAIPDGRLQSFWWAQQYKMRAGTREGAIPIDLMGPWYRITPWPKYWWNLNIQLTYYPFFASNHLELVKPLLKVVTDHLKELSENAPEPYRYNSAALGRSGPYTMTSGIKVLKGNDSTGASGASLELGNLTWLLHVCWQAYEYSCDAQIMQQLYPVLRRSINYYLHIMEQGADGKYHLPYTYSPEYPKGITRDANYDLSVFRWGCRTLLYMDEQLKLKDSLATTWKEVLNNLVPYPQDEYGFRIGRDASFTLSHRHYSHLLMVYPIHEINWDQPGNRDLIRRSLEQWENNNSAWRGYSYSGSGSIYAMMGNGNKTLSLLNDMIDKGKFAIKPNTMYLEAGPVIETPLSAVTTIDEMLLQSWGGIIRVFPAVPDEWKEAAFDKLRAVGAFEVSAVRRNGQTQYIKVKSLAGAPCRIKTGWNIVPKSIGKRLYTIRQLENGVIGIDLKKGEEVILYTGAKQSAYVMNAVGVDKHTNYWGLPAQH